MLSVITPVVRSNFRLFIEKQSGQNLSRCYQCGKCTAGCPVSYAMDLGPRQVMRAIQLGLKEEVLASKAIWLCVHCQTCSARCPREIDIARVMEACRLQFQLEKGAAADKDVALFHKLFLEAMGRWGRLSEVDLAANYNFRSGHFFANLGLVPGLLSRGKLSLPKNKGAGVVKQIVSLSEKASKGGAAPRKNTASPLGEVNKKP